MLTPPIIADIRKALETLPERKNIKSLKLFGSHAKGNAKKGSDIDLLIEFIEPVGLFYLFHVENEMMERLGIKVDLVTPTGISKYIRDDVLTSAVPVYDAA